MLEIMLDRYMLLRRTSLRWSACGCGNAYTGRTCCGGRCLVGPVVAGKASVVNCQEQEPHICGSELGCHAIHGSCLSCPRESTAIGVSPTWSTVPAAARAAWKRRHAGSATSKVMYSSVWRKKCISCAHRPYATRSAPLGCLSRRVQGVELKLGKSVSGRNHEGTADKTQIVELRFKTLSFQVCQLQQLGHNLRAANFAQLEPLGTPSRIIAPQIDVVWWHHCAVNMAWQDLAVSAKHLQALCWKMAARTGRGRGWPGRPARPLSCRAPPT